MGELTPRRKAIVLVSTFMDIGEEQEYNTPRYLSKDIAKECALIAVDEILDTIRIHLIKDPSAEEVVKFVETRIIYWQEVKQEIEKI